jgi:prevent-host-death family protein
MILVTATELKSNLGKYLTLSMSEDVYITKNGRSIAKLTAPDSDKAAILDELVGIIPDDGVSLDEIRNERLGRQ